MGEHPILFSGPMVQAIRDGRKTQTRRVVEMVHRRNCPWAYDENDDTGYEWVEAEPELSGHDYRQPCRCIQCPYGVPGDTLWVRETWQQVYPVRPGEWQAVKKPIHWRSNTKAKLLYAADCIEEPPKWRPSIHMPRWASRITLRVTDVRVQRVKDISESDAQAEGFDSDGVCGSWIRPFSLLWDSINAERGYGWDVNPWVFALTFEIAR